MRRDFFVYLVLLLAGLGGAYYISLPESKDASKSKVEWLKISPKAITQISYFAEKENVTATRQGSTDGFWVAAEAKTGEGAEAKVEKDEFKAATKFKDIVEDFNPFYIQRVVGAIKPEQEEEFGLKTPEGTFVVKTGDLNALELKIGKRSYGSKDLFALDVKQNKVILVSEDTIRNLQKAKMRLYERNLFEEPLDDVTGATLTADGKTKEFSHTKRDGSGELEWTVAGKDKGSTPVKTWMNQVKKLQVQEYAKADVETQLAQASPLLVLKFQTKNRGNVSLEFKKQPNAGGGQDYWLLSSFLGRYAKIASAKVDALEKDLPSIIGE